MSLLRELHRGGWLRAIDHALASSLRRLDPDTPDDVLAAAALASRALANGHSCLRLDKASALLEEIAPDRPQPPLPQHAAWIAALRASRLIGIAADEHAADAQDRYHGVPLVLERGRLFLRRYRDYEWRLATALRTRTGTALPRIHNEALAARLRELFPSADRDLDLQALAAVHALSSKLSLITGGPGTGKTSTIARVLVLLAEQAQREGRASPRIALAAPTGKAAARLAEALRENLDALIQRGVVTSEFVQTLPAQAQTLHRLLGWRSESIDFRHDAQHPLEADVVIVDEASMVDLPLMTKLAEAVRVDASLILLGDRDQLASVETGDVLAALCDAAGDGGAFPAAFARYASGLLDAPVSIAQENPHSVLAGQRIDLQRGYRQASGFDLAPLAIAVRDGEYAIAIDGLRAQRYSGVQWHERGDRDLAGTIREHALAHFSALAGAANPAAALALARRYRILTGLRFGTAGSHTINALIAGALYPQRSDALFHGQLLIVTENDYRHGLFNGDTGVVWRSDEGLRVCFDSSEGLRTLMPSQLSATESAWALTVHKAQGSEFEQVLLVLPEHDARVLSRELVYTGITRCRLGLELWATQAVLCKAIQRRGARDSGLAERFVSTGITHVDDASR